MRKCVFLKKKSPQSKYDMSVELRTSTTFCVHWTSLPNKKHEMS